MVLFYENAWRMNLGETKLIVAWMFGLGNVLFRMLAPVIIYPLTYFRGASLTERALSCLMPFFAWYGIQLYWASGVFSIGETIYYGLSSAFLFSFFNVVTMMGICEVFCRRHVKKQYQKQTVWSPGAVAAILSGPIGTVVLLVWGGGTHWFYFYQEGYKLFFH